jgi:hypothetical protein
MTRPPAPEPRIFLRTSTRAGGLSEVLKLLGGSPVRLTNVERPLGSSGLGLLVPLQEHLDSLIGHIASRR